jgi:hypothetical protein
MREVLYLSAFEVCVVCFLWGILYDEKVRLGAAAPN